MSLYASFWYKGIIKEQFRADISAAVKANDWSAVVSDDLKKILNKCFEGYIDVYSVDSSSTGIYSYKNDEVPEISDLSFDEESGLFLFPKTFNIYRLISGAIFNIEICFLPFITEKIISYYRWTEPMSADDIDSIVDVTDAFEDDMKKVDTLYKKGGLESIIERII